MSRDIAPIFAAIDAMDADKFNSYLTPDHEQQAAAELPLVVVFDDIQWGEETFLDLVEHVALLSAGAPLLLLCRSCRNP